MGQFYPFKFNAEKAVEVILYIARRAPIPDVFHVCKILYFADKYHLEQYGRFICGDYYIAMDNGPVPSRTYDIIKAVRDTQQSFSFSEHASDVFTLRGNQISPSRDAYVELLSQSDIESLDQAITEYGSETFSKLSELSHDDAWKAADQNSVIPIEKIASMLRDGDAIIEYLRNK
ncbi:MAG: SocA family protein [Acidobacteria bacterium]|nr:SocA family protein [Acidobacteriota bacterium]